MAIRHTIVHKGIDLEYWAITMTHWEKVTNQQTVNISVYKNKGTRDESPQNFFPDLTKTYYMQGINSLAECYSYIKTQEDFINGEDV